MSRPRFRPVRWLAVVAAVLAVAFAATPVDVAAHVNRTAGVYTFVVMLVEEPTYADNHSGFEFSVRRDGMPVIGLDASITAEARGHEKGQSLAVPPIDGAGFYVLDHATDGAPFDPLGGGAWTLFLTGAVDGTRVNLSFPVTFPSYPRIGTPAQQSATNVAEPASSSPSLVILLVALGATVAIGIAVVRNRRRGGRPAPI